MRDDLIPSRAALLQLRDEKDLMQEGHAFLDEKRALVAAEIVNQLKQYVSLQRTLETQWKRARNSLSQSIREHGFEPLGVANAPHEVDANLTTQTRSLLGVRLLETQLSEASNTGNTPADHLDGSRNSFTDAIKTSVELATCTSNLLRLYDDYEKTERRTRALEDVLIPELGSDIRQLQEQLETLEMEEAVRFHLG